MPPKTYHLSFTQQSDYLHAKVTGDNTPENVSGYLNAILEKCKQQHCTRLLIEERLEGPRLDIAKVFQIASQGSKKSFGVFTAIAYVDVNAEGDLMQFAETVAVNRFLPVKVFTSVADAEKWLQQKD